MTDRRPRPRKAVLLAATLLAAILLGPVLACGGSDPAATSPAETAATAAASDPPPTASTSPPATTAPAPTTSTSPPAGPEPPPAEEPSPVGPLEGRVVVVDPGHNGLNHAHPAEVGRPVDAGGLTKACNTTGTAAGDLTESAVNWDVATRLRDVLAAAGAEVVLTRPDDAGWGPCIDRRGLLAGEVGADALVSIHADGADPGAAGFHVIHSPRSGVGSPELAGTLRDSLVAAGLPPASYVGDGGLVARSDLGTLNRSPVASAMVECGNMHSAGDLAVLSSPEGRQRIADALAAGVVAHLTRSR